MKCGRLHMIYKVSDWNVEYYIWYIKCDWNVEDYIWYIKCDWNVEDYLWYIKCYWNMQDWSTFYIHAKNVYYSTLINSSTLYRKIVKKG